jgi:hypothetical protein
VCETVLEHRRVISILIFTFFINFFLIFSEMNGFTVGRWRTGVCFPLDEERLIERIARLVSH